VSGCSKKKREPQPPGEFQRYTKAAEDHEGHPTIRRWSHQTTPCRLVIPGRGSAEFLMIERRDGGLGAMVWSDGNGNRGTGGWLPLSALLMVLDITYPQNAPVSPTFDGILDEVASRRQEAVGQAAPAPSPETPKAG
jgi:hypothetical protein